MFEVLNVCMFECLCPSIADLNSKKLYSTWYLEIGTSAQSAGHQKKERLGLSWLTQQIPMNCEVTGDNLLYFCEYKISLVTSHQKSARKSAVFCPTAKRPYLQSLHILCVQHSVFCLVKLWQLNSCLMLPLRTFSNHEKQIRIP